MGRKTFYLIFKIPKHHSSKSSQIFWPLWTLTFGSICQIFFVRLLRNAKNYKVPMIDQHFLGQKKINFLLHLILVWWYRGKKYCRSWYMFWIFCFYCLTMCLGFYFFFFIFWRDFCLLSFCLTHSQISLKAFSRSRVKVL